MNQFFAGAAAVTVAIFLLGIRRKPIGALIKRNSDNPINSTQSLITLSIRQESKVPQSTKEKLSIVSGRNSSQAPLTKLEKIKLQKEIAKLIKGSPSERLKAVEISSQWSDKRVLPILRKGLKDSVSEIVIAAASGIEKFKGTQIFRNNQLSSKPRPPRNVSLMR